MPEVGQDFDFDSILYSTLSALLWVLYSISTECSILLDGVLSTFN